MTMPTTWPQHNHDMTTTFEISDHQEPQFATLAMFHLNCLVWLVFVHNNDKHFGANTTVAVSKLKSAEYCRHMGTPLLASCTNFRPPFPDHGLTALTLFGSWPQLLVVTRMGHNQNFSAFEWKLSNFILPMRFIMQRVENICRSNLISKIAVVARMVHNHSNDSFVYIHNAKVKCKTTVAHIVLKVEY